MNFLKSISKTFLALGLIVISASASANESAVYPEDSQACNSCCCGLACAPAPACDWGYNPPAYLRCPDKCCVRCGRGFFDSFGFRVDFLWWRPSSEGVTLGDQENVRTLPTVNSSQTTIVNTSSIQRPNFKFDPGFRLGIVHACPCECWDAELNWTHFHSKARATGETFGLPASGVMGTFTAFIPYWERVTVGTESVFPDTAVGHWKLDMDLLDLEFGHKYYVTSCFILRPHAGLRGGRINQSFRVSSTANRTTAPIFGPGIFTSDVHAKCNFLGMGPRLGVDLELDLGCGVSIFGQAAGSLCRQI